MIRILNAEPDRYCEQARQILKDLGELVETPCSQSLLLKLIPEFDVLIVRLGLNISAEIFKAGRRLKVIVTATTGLDHIDLEEAKLSGVKVLSLKGAYEFLRSIPATAELTWGIILALVRNIPQSLSSVLSGEWNRDLFRGYDLCDKQLGIVGLGRIGEKVAGYGLSFGMKVSAYDPYRINWIECVSKCSNLENLLRETDILSIHVPLNSETKLLIGYSEIGLLAPGSWIINTSRGEIIDEFALVEALTSGHIRGAALDVISYERDDHLRENSRLIRYAQSHNNLLITPHIGGATFDSMSRTEIFMAQKLAEYIGKANPLVV